MTTIRLLKDFSKWKAGEVLEGVPEGKAEELVKSGVAFFYSEDEAFCGFQEMNLRLENDIQKQRAWLNDYEGLHYSKGLNGKDLIKWEKEKEKYVYSDKTFSADINKIQRHKSRLVIEFDCENAQGYLEKIKTFLKEKGFGYIETTHKGKSNYIWIEFTRDITDREAKAFLEWIAPEGSVIDLNFANSNFRLPVMFAVHWKHSKNRELPAEFFKGKKCDYDSLNIKSVSGKTKNLNGYNVFEKEIKFNYEAYEPPQGILSLKEVEEVIRKNFPSIVFETKACLAACATLTLKHLNGCPSLNLIGNPSGEKTTALSFFYGQKETYLSDDFTPKAFVSHATNVKPEELEGIDLLPKIRNKVLISPELAPLFEAAKDKLLDNFAILTRVLDGEGLNRDSGSQGHRGYSGDYKFIWLGASTPLRANIWNLMGKIGNRLFFLNMREKNRTEKDYLEMFSGRAYEEKVKECRGVIRSFLDNLYNKNGIRKLEWNAEGDILLLPEIIRYAKFLSKLRGSLMTWKSEDRESYEFNFPIVEEPPRAINSLYNFAKGWAIINGRNFLKSEDLQIIKAICFSSMPHDRCEFLKLLAKHEGKLTTGQIQAELNCSDETARRTMKTFEVLGVVSIKSINVDSGGSGRPMQYIEINDDFKELLKEFSEVFSNTRVLNLEGNHKPQETIPVNDNYDNLKIGDLIKNE